MAKKKKRRRRVPNQPIGRDRHHILFFRREWEHGYKLLLRRAFIYDIPIVVHRALHAAVGNVPPLEDKEARRLWNKYAELDRELSLYEGLEWLLDNAPNEGFRLAIKAQYDFFKNNLGG